MWNRARAVGIALAAVVASFTLGACSNGVARSQSSTTTTSTTTIPTTTSTTVAATCQPSQLRILLYGSEGAAGTIELTFTLANYSTSLCAMYGYPGMQLLDASGASLPTVVIRGGTLAFEDIAATNVSLAPGQTAYFNLGYNDVVTGTTTCSMATQIEITPPNDMLYAVAQLVAQIDVCNGGTLHVSPVFSASDSAATGTISPQSQGS